MRQLEKVLSTPEGTSSIATKELPEELITTGDNEAMGTISDGDMESIDGLEKTIRS